MLLKKNVIYSHKPNSELDVLRDKETINHFLKVVL